MVETIPSRLILLILLFCESATYKLLLLSQANPEGKLKLAANNEPSVDPRSPVPAKTEIFKFAAISVGILLGAVVVFDSIKIFTCDVELDVDVTLVSEESCFSSEEDAIVTNSPFVISEVEDSDDVDDTWFEAVENVVCVEVSEFNVAVIEKQAAAPEFEVLPTGHKIHSEDPTGEYVPAKHWVHEDCPVKVVYDPAGQKVHVPAPAAE